MAPIQYRSWDKVSRARSGRNDQHNRVDKHKRYRDGERLATKFKDAEVYLDYDSGNSTSGRALTPSSSRSSSRSSRSSRTSYDEIDDYIDLLYTRRSNLNKLSDVVDTDTVRRDIGRRQYHWGEECARQFDMSLPYVIDMLYHMYECYDAVTVYSMAMLEPGMIIYYLDSYMLGLDQDNQGHGTAYAGGSRFEARVHCKGRFGVVIGKWVQNIKVAQMFTFQGRGLEAKPMKVWPEYVGLRGAEQRDWEHPSPHKPLEIGSVVCEMAPKTSVHLLTDKISLSNHILIAGRITPDSLARLQTLV